MIKVTPGVIFQMKKYWLPVVTAASGHSRAPPDRSGQLGVILLNHYCLQYYSRMFTEEGTRGSHNHKNSREKKEELRNTEIQLAMEGEELIAECVENQRETQKFLY